MFTIETRIFMRCKDRILSQSVVEIVRENMKSQITKTRILFYLN